MIRKLENLFVSLLHIEEGGGAGFRSEHDILRISLDGVVNGDFLITKLERHIFFLTTEQNYHGLPIEPPYFPMDMSIQRLPG